MAGVPTNVTSPFVGVDFDDTNNTAGLSKVPARALIIGQKLAGGTADAGKVYEISDPDEVIALAGAGSAAYPAAIKHRLNSSTIPLDMIFAAAPAGTASATVVSATGTATSSGELVGYLNNVRYATPVAVDDTIDEALAALAALVTADAYAQASAVGGVGILTLTSKELGLGVGDMDFRFNYSAGETTPAGFSITGIVYSVGTGVVTAAEFTAGIGERWYEVISGPFSDNTFLTDLQIWLDTQWSVDVQKDTYYFTGDRGSKSELKVISTAAARNSKLVNFGDYNARLNTISEFAAAEASATINSTLSVNDVATPLHRMPLVGIAVLSTEDVRSFADRNEMGQFGISTYTDDVGVRTENAVTMYLKNDSNGASDIYRLQNTLWTLLYLRFTFRSKVLDQYARAKLANSTEQIRSGGKVITPRKGKALAVAWFKELEGEGIVENLQQFKDDVRCERDLSNPNRLNWFLPPDLVNQLIVASANLGFKLQGVG
jgi:phage tail sheath gpL-like